MASKHSAACSHLENDAYLQTFHEAAALTTASVQSATADLGESTPDHASHRVQPQPTTRPSSSKCSNSLLHLKQRSLQRQQSREAAGSLAGKLAASCATTHGTGNIQQRTLTNYGGASTSATSSKTSRCGNSMIPAVTHKLNNHDEAHQTRCVTSSAHLDSRSKCAESEDSIIVATCSNSCNPNEKRNQQTLNAARIHSGKSSCSSLQQAAPAVKPVPANRDFSNRRPGSSTTGSTPRGVQLHAAWRQGPTDTAGTAIPICNQPILCSAASSDTQEVVVGSSDHALYTVSTRQRCKHRTLYTKTLGHTEWVTCVACLPDGRIVSGGMDSDVWLWPKAGTAGVKGKGHSESVSQVCTAADGNLVASCSYDKTVMLWRTTGRKMAVASRLQGHPAPVLQLDVSRQQMGEFIASGDRSGNVLAWNIASDKPCWSGMNAHQGHCTALAWSCMSGNDDQQHIFFSGGQDGRLRMWDMRTKGCVSSTDVHASASGTGAIGHILAGGTKANDKIVTVGANKTLAVLDPAMSCAVLSEVRLTDFPYSLTAQYGLALCGCGDGLLHVVDIQTGRTQYAVGANKAAIRGVHAFDDMLVCCGDDGGVMLYDFA